MKEIRRGNVAGNGSVDYSADDECDVPRRRVRKPKAKAPGIKRRAAAENALSVRYIIYNFWSYYDPASQMRIRLHMRSLIHTNDWLKDTVSNHDISDWDQRREQCCTADTFRLHLAGTPCDPWNASATCVFADDFLLANAATYPDSWTVRSMVLKKTRAYIKTLIKSFRNYTKNEAAKEEKRRAKNRRERKANVSAQQSLLTCI